MSRVNCRGFNPGFFENIAQAYACPLRTADSADRPLVAGSAWVEERTPITTAFENEGECDFLEVILQIVKAQ